MKGQLAQSTSPVDQCYQIRLVGLVDSLVAAPDWSTADETVELLEGLRIKMLDKCF